MVSLDRFRGRTVAFDTAPFIYLIEDHPTFSGPLLEIFEAMTQGDFQGVTSTITLLEVLVHPLRNRQPVVAEQYRSVLLGAANLQTVPMNSEIAERAAAIRASHGYATPDAIQLATALHLGAAIFVTNDTALKNTDLLDVVLVGDLVAPGA